LLVNVKTLKRNIFQRIFGRPATKPPKDVKCWTYAGGKVIIDLDRAPELSEVGGAIRLESDELPKHLLVVCGLDGEFHVFCNQCAHMGRRLDPVPGTETVQCCSIGKSTYDYEGNKLAGPAPRAITRYALEATDGKLIVTIG
jgi:nitrite reductase/ring-hydroxylating ferredoxin subunit